MVTIDTAVPLKLFGNISEMYIQGIGPRLMAKKAMNKRIPVNTSHPFTVADEKAKPDNRNETVMPSEPTINNGLLPLLSTVYMAISSKSNSVYMAINDAINDIKSGENIAVPHHLKKQGEKDYLYPHSYSENFVKQEYISGKKQYYVPGNNKNERLIKEKLLKLWGKKYEY